MPYVTNSHSTIFQDIQYVQQSYSPDHIDQNLRMVAVFAGHLLRQRYHFDDITQ